MANRLETAITTHRARVRSIDRATLASIYAAYQDVMERLEPLIELVEQEAEDAGALTAARLFQLERWQELQRQVEEEMIRLATATEGATTAAQRQAVVEAVRASFDLSVSSAAATRAQASIAAGWTQLPTWAMEDLIGATAGGPLRELLDSFGETAARVLTEEVVSGLALGRSPRTVADAIHRATDIGRNRALTIARTEMIRSMRSASIRNYQANRDVLSGWAWTAAHQARTCAACLAMDGTIHPLEEPFHSHPNCRCAPRPYLRGVPMREVPTGDQWLSQQPAEVQDQVLGKSGGAAYRSGEVALMDFVRVDESRDWGRSVRDGGIGWARLQAGGGRLAA